MPNPKRYLNIAGSGFTLAGLLVILALAAWWLRSGYWVTLSCIDAVGLMSPDAAALATDMVTDSDVLYFIFADAPLYGLLLVVGAALFASGLWRRLKAGVRE